VASLNDTKRIWLLSEHVSMSQLPIPGCHYYHLLYNVYTHM